MKKSNSFPGIYTGYYSKMKKYKELGLVSVSIAWGTPVWYFGETCFDLAPPYKIIKAYKTNEITQEEYAEQYNEFHENQVKWSKVFKELREISGKYDNADLVLVCFEKSEDFCHRHLLADYINEQDIGITIEECDI